MAVRGKRIGKTATTRLAAKRAAMQMNAVYDMLEKGKTTGQAKRALGISPRSFSEYVSALRESTRATRPLFIPPKGAYNWSRAKARRCENLIEYATKIIKGEKPVKARKKRQVVVQWALPETTHKKIAAALVKDPFASHTKIASGLQCSRSTVNRTQKRLVAAGLIQPNLRGKRLQASKRKPEKITGVLDKKKREEILARNSEEIEKIAGYLYRTNQHMFDTVNLLQEEIVEKLRDRLDWKLQRFDPNKIGGPEKDKVKNYFNRMIWAISRDLRSEAGRRYAKRKTFSLEAGMEEEKDKKRYLPAKPESKEATAEQLEQMSNALKLNVLDKAILFGTEAGLSYRKIAEITGYTVQGIFKRRTVYQKRIKKMLNSK